VRFSRVDYSDKQQYSLRLRAKRNAPVLQNHYKRDHSNHSFESQNIDLA